MLTVQELARFALAAPVPASRGMSRRAAPRAKGTAARRAEVNP